MHFGCVGSSGWPETSEVGCVLSMFKASESIDSLDRSSREGEIELTTTSLPMTVDTFSFLCVVYDTCLCAACVLSRALGVSLCCSNRPYSLLFSFGQLPLSRSRSDESSQDLRDSSRSLKATRLSNGNSTFDSHRIFPHSPFHSTPPFDAVLRSSTAHKLSHALVVNQKVRGRLGVRRIPLPENSPFLSPFLPSHSPDV